MRRDDAKRLIAALIRRRHNDALRIKKLRSRLNDRDEYELQGTGAVRATSRVFGSFAQAKKEALDYARSQMTGCYILKNGKKIAFAHPNRGLGGPRVKPAYVEML